MNLNDDAVLDNFTDSDNQIEPTSEINLLKTSQSLSKCLNDHQKAAASSTKNETENKHFELNIRNLIDYLFNSKLRSNFYSFIISLLLIHFWILCTYLTGYLFSPTVYAILMGNGNIAESANRLNSHYNISIVIEIVASGVGGFGAALFFKNIILSLFESSHFLIKYQNDSRIAFSMILGNLNTNNTQRLTSKFFFKNL